MVQGGALINRQGIGWWKEVVLKKHYETEYQPISLISFWQIETISWKGYSRECVERT